MTKINRPFEIRRYREITLQAYCSLPALVTPLQGYTPSTPRFEGKIYKRFLGDPLPQPGWAGHQGGPLSGGGRRRGAGPNYRAADRGGGRAVFTCQSRPSGWAPGWAGPTPGSDHHYNTWVGHTRRKEGQEVQGDLFGPFLPWACGFMYIVLKYMFWDIYRLFARIP